MGNELAEVLRPGCEAIARWPEPFGLLVMLALGGSDNVRCASLLNLTHDDVQRKRTYLARLLAQQAVQPAQKVRK
jgi:hypothetical protein